MGYSERAVVDLGLVEQHANYLLALGGVVKPPVSSNLISVFDTASRILVVVKPIAPLRGVVQRDPRGWSIVIDKGLPRGAKRFTLFHEGFHILLELGTIQIPGPEQYLEWLADAFAARVLMPRRWLVESVKKAGDINQLCATYQVSHRAINRRLKELDLCLSPWSTSERVL
ncbi:MAG: ImmA/IrrE family metallo-endopeptidase [Chloroflexi bacterium]|nr:ImmA/IrrE family metallo-endopeptidase [Chloroflexota bacterium]